MAQGGLSNPPPALRLAEQAGITTTRKNSMKKSLTLMTCVAAVFLAATAIQALASVDMVTITGQGKCAKCSLKLAKECQTVIQADKDGKTVTYYLADNDVARNFHENVCKQDKTVTATGTVEEKDGKMQLTATKIEVVKKAGD
jgi:hypothetical protein